MEVSGFGGVVTPIVTPIDADGSVDHNALRTLVTFLLDHGIHGVMVNGSTGEGMLLRLAERREILETVVDTVDGRCLVIAHVGCASTRDTISLTHHAQAAQVDAISAIVPYYYPYDDDSLLAHFSAVGAAARDLPMLVYTFPNNARNDVSPELLAHMQKRIPNLMGIKASTNDLTQVQRYIEASRDGFLVLSGADTLMLAALAVGVSGAVSGNSNAFPEVFLALYDAFQASDLDRALVLQKSVNAIVRSLACGGCYIARLKAMLQRRGLPGGEVLAPMRPLTTTETAELDRDWARIRDRIAAHNILLQKDIRSW